MKLKYETLIINYPLIIRHYLSRELMRNIEPCSREINMILLVTSTVVMLFMTFPNVDTRYKIHKPGRWTIQYSDVTRDIITIRA